MRHNDFCINEEGVEKVQGDVRHVLLVDDDALFLETLALVLAGDPSVDVVGTASNGIEAVRVVGELRPDVVTMDIDMPLMDGIAATRAIAKRYPETCVVTITGSTSSDRIAAARAAGASGHVTKSDVVDELPAALHAACPSGTRARAA